MVDTAAPVPPQARQLQTGYGPDSPGNDTTLVRITSFEIDQPEVAVRAFYRTALTRWGGTYTHVWPGCWSQGKWVLAEDFDLYRGFGRVLEVHVGNRRVEVVERGSAYWALYCQ